MQKPDHFFEAYIFDLDGTVFLGEALLPTAGETINKLLFDTGKEKIRVTLAAGITVNDFNSESDFTGLAGQAETALTDALRSQSDKTVTYSAKTEAPVPVLLHFAAPGGGPPHSTLSLCRRK